MPTRHFISVPIQRLKRNKFSGRAMIKKGGMEIPAGVEYADISHAQDASFHSCSPHTPSTGRKRQTRFRALEMRCAGLGVRCVRRRATPLCISC